MQSLHFPFVGPNMKLTFIGLVFGLLNAPALATTFIFQGPAVIIPPKGPADPSFIYVEGVAGVVRNIKVNFNGFLHKFGEETLIAVTNPDGWATLIWDAADCKFNTVDITLDDEAETSIESRCGSGAVLGAGSYRPGYAADDRELTIPIAPMRPMFQTLKELIMPNPNGRWILWAEDYVSGDGGAMASWEIIVETEETPADP